MKTCAFYTLGCKVNQYETQSIRESFIKAGYEEVKFNRHSDIYVINTCTVTARTDKESRRLIREVHRRNPLARIVVTGCYVELNEDEIKDIPGVRFIVKNRDKDKIIDIINSKEIHYTQSSDNVYLSLAISDFKDRTKAFLKVQDGCNNFCSYCKIPFVRGRSRSRDIESAVAEFKCLITKGFKEIVLTGICIGAWGEDFSAKRCFSELLERLVSLGGDFRIRLSSIEPKYVNIRLALLIESSPKLCRQLHIPLQSGDDEILKKMNRPYTADKYIDIIEMIRSKIPEISITTDILVGFPGETDENFSNTCRLIEKIRPSRIHIFSYSPRERTAVLGLGGEISKDIVKKRMSEMKDLASSLSYKYRKDFLQRETKVLVEQERDRQTGFLKGYDDKYIKILLKGPDYYKSKIIPVRIEKIEMDSTFGVIL
jgi:threonylcarbamoyladenosine tRNA methylthiotransferase MtaB